MAGDGVLVGKRLGLEEHLRPLGTRAGCSKPTTCDLISECRDESESLVVAPIVLGSFGRKIIRAAANTLKGF
jgi:hypothetical protein